MMLKTTGLSRGLKADSKKWTPTSALVIILIMCLILVLLSLLFQFNQISRAIDGSDRWVDYTLSQAASMIAQNNTLILCTMNEPYLPLLNNWLISVSRHKHQDKVLVIAEDYPTFLKVNNKWPGHAVLLSPTSKKTNQGGAYRFGSHGFKNLTYKRAQYLLQILELGYNVMFNDVDIVWLADPFPYMKGEHDVYFADDRLDIKPLNHSNDLPPLGRDGTTYICAGMMYLRPTSGSKLLMKMWIKEIIVGRHQPDNDQLAFNRALNKIKIAGQAKLYLLPQTGFPAGGLYFGNRKWVKKNEGKQVIIHNNYIIGLEKKIQRLQRYGLWFVGDHVSA